MIDKDNSGGEVDEERGAEWILYVEMRIMRTHKLWDSFPDKNIINVVLIYFGHRPDFCGSCELSIQQWEGGRESQGKIVRGLNDCVWTHV